MIIRRDIVAAGVLAVIGVFVLFHDDQDPNDPGQFSAFTRDQLRTSWKHTDLFPLLVPVTMPAGATANDEPGFTLVDVGADRQIRASRRVWVSFYESDALGAPGTSFRIFQRPADAASDEPCGPMHGVPHLTRHVDEAVLTICSTSLYSGSAARQYWREVELTADLDEVGWLEG